MSRVSVELIAEWTESKVNEELLLLINRELEYIRNSPISDNLIRGNPQLTQENLVENTARELEWETFKEIISGDWSSLETEDEE